MSYSNRWPFYISVITILIVLASTTTSADEIILNSGENIKGKITATDDNSTTIEHEIFGEQTIPADKIKSITITEKSQVAAEVEAAEVEGTGAENITIKKPDSAFVTFLKVWNTNFEIGFNTSSGDTESAFFMTALNMKKETDTNVDRFQFRYIFELKDEGDGDDRNESTTTYWHDWKTETEWIYYVIARLETDEFKSWDYRVTSNGGVGYRFMEISKDDPIDLTGKLGIGGSQELGSADEDFSPEAAIGGSLAWNVSDWSTLEATATYLPNLTDASDYRILATLDWIVKVNSTIAVKFGLNEEFESVVEPGDANNNLKTYGSLVIGF